MSRHISLFDPSIRDDPYPVYRWLRDEAPVYQEPDYGTFVLTRFEDVYDALKDHGTFSSAMGIAPGLSQGNALMTTMITTDPPRHTRLRALVNKTFTPRVLARLEPWLEGIVEDCLSDVSGREVEIVRQLTVPLPVTAIARLLGIPPEDRERFKEWSDAVLGITDSGLREDARAKVQEMLLYFAEMIASRKAQPHEDLISTIAAAEVDGQGLTDFEMLGFCLLLLIAGNETTTNLIGNLLDVLSVRPDLWERLRADRDLVPAAVEEALRYDSPVQALWRTTTREVELHGVHLPAGSRVMVVYAAANRDDREFPDPDEFQLERNLMQHLAFGHGIHFCLGAPLARLEAKVALNGLLDRFERISPGGGGKQRVPTAILRGFASLSLRLEP